jgi:hypothetical protein
VLPALLLCAAIALTGAGEAAAALTCGKTITKDRKLKADVLDCPGDGLLIEGNDITLDLNGHRIDGDGAVGSFGIRSSNDSGVVIKGGGGGRVTGFDDGVRIGGGAGNVIRGVEIKGSKSTGLELNSSNGSRAVNNAVVGSKAFGIQLVAIDDARVLENEVVGPRNSSFSVTGISVNNPTSEGNLVKGNLVRGGAAGTWGILVNGTAQGTRISRNVTRGSSQEGIQVYDNAAGSVVRGNRSLKNGGSGIEISATAGAGTGVGGNRALDNGNWGILAAVAVTDLGGNVAGGNGQAAQCSGVTCSPP